MQNCSAPDGVPSLANKPMHLAWEMTSTLTQGILLTRMKKPLHEELSEWSNPKRQQDLLEDEKDADERVTSDVASDQVAYQGAN